MKSLEALIAAGHGHCLEAIKQEPDDVERLHKLREYVDRTPKRSKQHRRAVRMIEQLENSLEIQTSREG